MKETVEKLRNSKTKNIKTKNFFGYILKNNFNIRGIHNDWHLAIIPRITSQDHIKHALPFSMDILRLENSFYIPAEDILPPWHQK